MTCREARQHLERGGMGNALSGEDEGLAHHLALCDRCREASKVARFTKVLFGALREDLEPGPTFYPHLRARLAGAAVGQFDVGLLQAWEFARRFVPAVALGVLLLAGVTISSGGSRLPSSLEARPATEFQAFPADGLSLPVAVERPSQDQILAFVLTTGDPRSAEPESSGAGSGE